MTYYVEPDYWVSGYAVGDTSGVFVFGSGLSTGSGTCLIAGNYIVASHVERSDTFSEVRAGGSFVQTFPGIDLNSNSSMFAAGVVTSNSNGALIDAHSDVRMTGRPFWELTSPASGTWTTIVPQAEGTGK